MGEAGRSPPDARTAPTPVRQAHPFDGFDKLTTGRLRMTPSGVEWVRVLSEVERARRPPSRAGSLCNVIRYIKGWRAGEQSPSIGLTHRRRSSSSD